MCFFSSSAGWQVSYQGTTKLSTGKDHFLARQHFLTFSSGVPFRGHQSPFERTPFLGSRSFQRPSLQIPAHWQLDFNTQLFRAQQSPGHAQTEGRIDNSLHDAAQFETPPWLLMSTLLMKARKWWALLSLVILFVQSLCFMASILPIRICKHSSHFNYFNFTNNQKFRSWKKC